MDSNDSMIGEYLSRGETTTVVRANFPISLPPRVKMADEAMLATNRFQIQETLFRVRSSARSSPGQELIHLSPLAANRNSSLARAVWKLSSFLRAAKMESS